MSAAVTLVDRLYIHGASRSAQVALLDPDTAISWGELEARSNRIANALMNVGVSRGTRAAVLGGSNATAALVILSVLKAGASVVPLPTLLDAGAILRMIGDSESRVLFAAQRFLHLLRAADLPGVTKVALDFAASGWLSVQDFVSAADEARPQIEVRADDEFNIIYSSGTTGTPKGIVQDHALRAYAAQSLAPIGFPPGVRTLVNTSLYSNWTLGALIYTLWAGGSVRFSGKFSPPGLLAQCREFRPQNVYLVPVQISRLLDDAPADALRALPPALKWTAGSYLAPELKSALQRSWPGGVVEIYGMTEGAPFTLLEVHRHPDKVHTVGRSDPPEDLKIIDEQGCELPPGERGEIVGRVRHVMRGYKGDEPGTQALVWRDTRGIAYFRSGDIGMLDEEGFLQVVDRKKDMIISGGFNVYAADLESVLARHPQVAQAAVFAIPSQRWGESPAAAVVLRPEHAGVTAEEIRVWANERLGSLQRLAEVHIVPKLPRGSLGKVLKRELRIQLATASGSGHAGEFPG